MFGKLKKIFGIENQSSVGSSNNTAKNTKDVCQIEKCPIDNKFDAVYYNTPIGMVTISLDKRTIMNYNLAFSSLFINFYYPLGIGKNFSDIVFKNNFVDFDTWISNTDENSMRDVIEIKLVRDKMGAIDIPILVKLNKLLVSKQENIIVLSVIGVDTYLDENLRIEEEKYLLEKNNCLKNKIFIDTFSELKVTLTKLINHEEQTIEPEKLTTMLDIVDNVLEYYKHNPNICPYCSSDHSTDHIVAERIRNRFNNVRILLVDDMDVNLDIVADMLTGFIPTCVVDKAKNGKQALDMIEKNKYDIVLIDLVMPVMDGFETIEKLRDDDNGYDAMELPIVVLTALSHKSDKDRALGVGVNDYLTKPINPRELIRVLEKWV